MSSEEIRKKFFEFFEKRGHTRVPSSSLIPTDPSVLLTTAGMQQFKRYFTGALNANHDFGSRRTVSIQKCFRTSDIDSVGDETHLTFFEMLGNFSFGPVGRDDPNDFGHDGYFKRSAIHWGYEFLTKDLGIASNRISVSVFKGDKDVPRDEYSFKIWHEEIGLSKNKISESGREDNFWGPTGSEGPCGPTAEIYVDGLEVWNLVFNEYYQKTDKTLEKLKNPGVDTGMGLERLAMVVQKVPTVFETDLFKPIFDFLSQIQLKGTVDIRENRIIADHLRAGVFLMSENIKPGKNERDSVLRRILDDLFINLDPIKEIESLINIVIDNYSEFYPELITQRQMIIENFYLEQRRVIDISDKVQEVRKFLDLYSVSMTSLQKRKFNEETAEKIASLFFDLHQSYGSRLEMTRQILINKGIVFGSEIWRKIRILFDHKMENFRNISRSGVEKKFGGHGLILNTGELKAGDEAELKKVTRLHTATHLLHRALREVLGNDVHQMGSDITTERTRFDFSFNRKMTPEEIKKVEEIANEKMKEDLPVQFKEMAKSDAEKTGALHFFKEKYPEKVRVYYIGRDLAGAWSKEFCGGPHVTHTGEIGQIKILKEEAVGAGTRRIRATVE